MLFVISSSFFHTALNSLVLFCGGDWSLNSGLSACKAGAVRLSHRSSSFCSGYFEYRVLPTILLGWLWTSNLPTSASHIGLHYWNWRRIVRQNTLTEHRSMFIKWKTLFHVQYGILRHINIPSQVIESFKLFMKCVSIQGEHGDASQGTPGGVVNQFVTHFRRDAFSPRRDRAVGGREAVSGL
jgi:hypothetical protein